MPKNVVGNSICTTREQYIAEFLKKRNLNRVNDESEKVTPKRGIYSCYVKRCLDIIISLLALVITFPINFIIAICTFFDVGRPIFFSQTRVGKNGKEFKLVKFRNMTNATDVNGKLLPASERVTRFGKFVRKTSLDELLNFWSILKGDMSIIGPRPLPVFFRERYSERHKMREAVKPGLECPRIKRNSQVPRYQEQFENDIWYVENISFKTDMIMLCELFKITFNSKYRKMTAGAASYFVGYSDDNYAISEKYAMLEYPELEKMF